MTPLPGPLRLPSDRRLARLFALLVTACAALVGDGAGGVDEWL